LAKQTTDSIEDLLLHDQLRKQFPQLSPRQLEIVGHLASGRGERQIADLLQIARTTVHVHIKELYVRVGVRTRGELLGGIIKRLSGLISEQGLAEDYHRHPDKSIRSTGVLNGVPTLNRVS
jgi:DNA-binding CsgD family transcriptional regulator